MKKKRVKQIGNKFYPQCKWHMFWFIPVWSYYYHFVSHIDVLNGSYQETAERIYFHLNEDAEQFLNFHG